MKGVNWKWFLTNLTAETMIATKIAEILTTSSQNPSRNRLGKLADPC